MRKRRSITRSRRKKRVWSVMKLVYVTQLTPDRASKHLGVLLTPPQSLLIYRQNLDDNTHTRTHI